MAVAPDGKLSRGDFNFYTDGEISGNPDASAYGVVFMDEQSSTCRGIRLGSQKGDVQSAYAAYSADFDGSTVTLTSDGDYSLSFLFDNDKLVGILSFSKEKNILHNNDLNEGKKNIEPKQGELSDEEFDIYSRYGNPVSPLPKPRTAICIRRHPIASQNAVC